MISLFPVFYLITSFLLALFMLVEAYYSLSVFHSLLSKLFMPEKSDLVYILSKCPLSKNYILL